MINSVMSGDSVFRYAMSKLMRAMFLLFLTSAAAAAQNSVYVSPDGSDSNPGTISLPYQTIAKAMSVASAGTIIYLRAGTYTLNATLKAGVSGTATDYINLWAYPGEKPILNFSGESYSSSSRGIELKRDYWYLRGLTIENAGDNGIFISGSHNIIENCSVSYCKDTGIQISSGGSYNYIHNCDAFDNNDPATEGQNADGIDVKLDGGPGNVLRGCRVYDNSDDGYDCYGTPNRVVFDSCWAFHNGYNLWNIQGFTGNGNGFKLGGADSVGPHIVTNCVSFDNTVKGFDQNNNMAGIVLHNCTAYRNGTYNFSFPETPKVGIDTFMNDLSIDPALGDTRIVAGAVQDSNSWQGHNVTDADFLSLDTSLARLPRLAGGSLPATPLLRLAPGSSLIDAGIDVGIPFKGKASDIGAFESGTGPVVLSTNGTGGGDWNSTATWAGGVVPDTSDYVVILGGDSVTVSGVDTARCGDLNILSTGKLNGFGPMVVKGMLSLLPNAWYYNSNSKAPSFPVAASYDISPQGNYVHTSSAGSTLGSAGYDSIFGNVIVLKSGTTCGANLTINGNLIINTGGASSNFRATNASVNRSLTQTVKGNVSIISGQWACVDGGNDLTGIWNIMGNVTAGDSSTASGMARMGPFSSSSSSHRLGVFNITGDLHLVNGAKLQAGSSTGSTSTTETGIINLTGNLTVDSTAVFGTNSLGVFAFNFVGASAQVVALHAPFVMSSTQMQPVINDTIKAGTSVMFVQTGKPWVIGGPGTFVVNGTLALPQGDTIKGGQGFRLNAGALLGMGSPEGLDSTGNIQLTGEKVFSSNASYVFNGTSPQVTGNWMPDTAYKLTTVNSSGLTLSKGLVVSGMVNVAAGRLILGKHSLVAGGTGGGTTGNYIVTDSTGMLKITAVSGNQVLFPVGTTDGYAPVWVATGSEPETISVSVSPDSGTSAQANARVNLKWKIVSSSVSGGSYSLKFGWMKSEEDSAFAANRASFAEMFLEKDSSTYVEAGSGDYTTSFASEPYTVSQGNVPLLGTFVVGNFGATPIRRVETIPAVFKLYQNYPNPFNPTTTIQFTVAKRGVALLRVYNILGQRVTTLFSGDVTPGRIYSVPFNAGELSSGVYFEVLESGGQRQIHKMVLMK